MRVEPTPRSDLAPGALAGRYTVGDRLASGGMGEVRAGHDERLGRDVAVKFLHPELLGHDDARRRFEVEARAAARLVHPNVVTVYDCGEEAGVPFLVMELLPGRTLRDELDEGPVSAARAREVASEILAALAAAHDAGILHRDVKPGNVLLTDDGHVKVTDFGIAKLVEGADATLTTELLATPVYLAPERFDGAPASPSSDLYSVGVLLYEALTGRRPFAGTSPAEVFAAMQQGTAVPLADVRADVPPDVAGAVSRAMDPDPGRRFGSARAMADALAVADPPTAAAPAAGDDATLRADATATLVATPPARLEPPAPRLRAPRARPRRALAVLVGAALLAAVVVGFVTTRDDATLVPPDGTPTTTVALSPEPAVPAATPTVELPPALQRSIDELERLTTR